MGTWISKDGIQTPAKERVALTNNTGKVIYVDGKPVNPGEPYIYDGPDRSATEYLKEQGVTHLGQHFTKDPEIIMRARQMNMTVDEFCQTSYYTEEMRKKDQAEKEKVVELHQDPPRKKGNKFPSGGRNTAGNAGHLEGDFGGKEEAVSKVK